MAYVPPPLIEQSLDRGNVGEEPGENVPLLPQLIVPRQESENLPTSSSNDLQDVHMHAPPHQANQASASSARRNPPAITAPPTSELPGGLPDPGAFWYQHSNRIWLYICLVNSVVLLVMSIGEPFLFLTMISGVIGIGFTCMHLIRRSSGGRDLAKETKNGIILALSGLILSLLSIVQLSWVVFLGSLECRYDPKDAPEKDCIVTFVYLGTSIVLVSLQAVCFQKLLNKTGIVSRMLNPVSSGMVSLA